MGKAGLGLGKKQEFHEAPKRPQKDLLGVVEMLI